MRPALLLAALLPTIAARFVAGTALAGGANIYIRATAISGTSMDVVVGNSGTNVNTTNFDALMTVRSGTRDVCRLETNFVTPLDAGMVVRTFRLEGQTYGPRVAYVVDVSVRFWEEPSSDGEPADNRHTAVFVLPGVVRCVTLKPVQ